MIFLLYHYIIFCPIFPFSKTFFKAIITFVYAFFQVFKKKNLLFFFSPQKELLNSCIFFFFFFFFFLLFFLSFISYITVYNVSRYSSHLDSCYLFFRQPVHFISSRRKKIIMKVSLAVTFLAVSGAVYIVSGRSTEKRFFIGDLEKAFNTVKDVVDQGVKGVKTVNGVFIKAKRGVNGFTNQVNKDAHVVAQTTFDDIQQIEGKGKCLKC